MYHSDISRRSVKLLPRYGPLSIFQDGGRPPSWICYTFFWTTHEEYLVVFNCHNAKFGLNRCSNFDNVQVLIGLKMPIRALLGIFLG